MTLAQFVERMEITADEIIDYLEGFSASRGVTSDMPTLSTIPDDMIREIGKHLGDGVILRFSEVSHRVNRAVRDARPTHDERALAASSSSLSVPSS